MLVAWLPACVIAAGTSAQSGGAARARNCRRAVTARDSAGIPALRRLGGNAGSRSHFGCQISRNFHASADFDNNRSGPAHGLLLQVRLRPRGLSPGGSNVGPRPSNARPWNSATRAVRAHRLLVIEERRLLAIEERRNRSSDRSTKRRRPRLQERSQQS